MLKHLLAILILIASCFQLSSCRNIAASVLFGIDASPEWKDENELNKDFRKFDIPEDSRFLLDTTYSTDVIAELKDDLRKLKASGTKSDSLAAVKKRKIANDNMQPTQLRYFDSKGNPVFKMVNCYIDPPIPMKWNVDGCLDVFPPATKEENLNKGNKDLKQILTYLSTSDGKPVAFADLPEADYYAVIFWNSFYKRPSKKLIRQIKKYDQKHPGQTTHFLFVNNHNSSIWVYLSQEQKEEVKKEITEQPGR